MVSKAFDCFDFMEKSFMLYQKEKKVYTGNSHWLKHNLE